MRILPLFLFAVCLAGCEKPIPGAPAQSPAFPEQKPVVTAPPVQTIPFEDGYKAGFDLGIAEAKPRYPMPAVAEVIRRAEEAAGEREERNQKWRDGWRQGYLDGFRQRSTRAR
jgi:hypothetical protein